MMASRTQRPMTEDELLAGITDMYVRCICVADHDLNGTEVRCLNRVPLGRRKCDDCLIPAAQKRRPEWMRRAQENRLPSRVTER